MCTPSRTGTSPAAGVGSFFQSRSSLTIPLRGTSPPPPRRPLTHARSGAPFADVEGCPPRTPQVIGSSEMNNHAHAPSETVGRGACACSWSGRMFPSVVQLKTKKQKEKQQIPAGTSIQILMHWVFWSFHGIYC